MSPPDRFSFGAWEVRLATRELRLRGTVQEVEPKVFDLLAFLIAQRHRVVPRGELLDQVWGTVVVSENVIARTVMKARKAIGDRADETSMIRTVHRVGYRFVGEPQAAVALRPRAGADADVTVDAKADAEMAADVDADVGAAVKADGDSDAPPVLAPEPGFTVAAAAPLVARPLLRFGLLPVVNLTGEPELLWVHQGLTALVAQALERDPRLSVAPVQAIERALEGLAGQPLQEPRGRSVERLLGLHCVVEATIRRLGELYRIDYHAHGPRANSVEGHVSGDEVTALGQRLAQRIEAQLFPDAQAEVQLQSSDPFANQTFARAMRARSEERWHSAARLLQVVMDIEPGSDVAACHCLAMLAATYDPTAFAFGERLLRRAEASGDARFRATVHQALGQAHVNLRGPHEDESMRHMDEALRLAEEHAEADWALRICMSRARYEQLRRNYPRARELFDRAARGCEAKGNRMDLAKIVNSRAIIDALTGNLLGARHWMEQSLRMSEELRLESSIVASAGNLAEADAQLGFLGKAAELCDSLVRRIGSTQDVRLAAGVMVTVCGVYRETWSVDRIGHAIATVTERADGDAPGARPFLAVARALQAAAHGDQATASTAMAEGVRLIEGEGNAFMVDQWLPVLLHMELCRHRLDRADAVLAELRALPQFGDDDARPALALRVDAMRAHAAGDSETARAAFEKAALLLPAGRWSALAKLDAAWLHLECGDVASARLLLRDLGPWLEGHPAGWLVQARSKAASGLWTDAVEAQARFLRIAPAEHGGEARRFGALYREGAAGRAVTLPLARRLPSVC